MLTPCNSGKAPVRLLSGLGRWGRMPWGEVPALTRMDCPSPRSVSAHRHDAWVDGPASRGKGHLSWPIGRPDLGGVPPIFGGGLLGVGVWCLVVRKARKVKVSCAMLCLSCFFRWVDPSGPGIEVESSEGAALRRTSL